MCSPAAHSTRTAPIPPEAAVPTGAESEAGTALGEEFWLVRPMVFTTLHFSEDGTEHRDCFVDSDGIVRLPYGLTSAETVTHWAELPTLPGGMTHAVLGKDAIQRALRRKVSRPPACSTDLRAIALTLKL